MGDAFQSTPANFTAGDLLRRQAQHDRHRVSIHAHQFHGGRLLATAWAFKWLRFQSTPTNFMAGDVVSGVDLVMGQLFQSTPANFTAGDSTRPARMAWSPMFQSTPANFTAGDASAGLWRGRG